jgi:hypothetical protein
VVADSHHLHFLKGEGKDKIFFRWTILVNPCVSTVIIRDHSLVLLFVDSSLTFFIVDVDSQLLVRAETPPTDFRRDQLALCFGRT